MSYLRDDAAHWFARAAELRTQAAGLSDPEAQRKMLELADSCTTMALAVKARAAALNPGDQGLAPGQARAAKPPGRTYINRRPLTSARRSPIRNGFFKTAPPCGLSI